MRMSGVVSALALVLLLWGCGNQTIPYRQEDHRCFTEEFAPQEDVHGWWYITGYAGDVNDPNRLYAFVKFLPGIREDTYAQ